MRFEAADLARQRSRDPKRSGVRHRCHAAAGALEKARLPIAIFCERSDGFVREEASRRQRVALDRYNARDRTPFAARRTDLKRLPMIHSIHATRSIHATMFFAHSMTARVFAFVSIIVAAGAGSALAQWPQFRGDHFGSAPGELPSRWEAKDYRWTIRTEVADVGSPIIDNDHVYFLSSTQTADAVTLHCVKLDSGQEIWSHQTDHHPYRVHARNSQAASTPATDNIGVVYASADDRNTFLIAVNHEGEEIWRRDFGPWISSHGFAASPAINDDQVVLLMSGQGEELEEGQQPGESFVICVDRMTGKTNWQCPLAVTRTCYGVPTLVADDDNSVWLVPHRGDGLVAIDAEDGTVLWKAGELAKRVCSSIAISGATIILSEGGGSRGILHAFKFDPKNVAQPATLAYSVNRAAPYVPSVAIAGQNVYRVDDSGIATVQSIETGKTKFRRRLGGNYGASPVVVGDHWLALSLDGDASVIRSESPFDVVDQFSVGGRVSATPAVGGGYLVIRAGTTINALPLGEAQ